MKRMKKILALLLAAIMLLGLAACGSTESEGSDSEGGKSGGKSKSKETPAPEYVYTATYEPVTNKFENLSYFYPTMTTEDGFYCVYSEVVGQRELMEGEVLEWEGQLDIYEPRLYRLGVDGTLTRLESYQPMKFETLEEGHGISGGVNQMVLTADGGLLTLENSYEYWSDAGEGVDMYSDEWFSFYQYKESYYLRRLDADGKELSCAELDVEELKQGQDYVYFNGIASVDEHQALLAGENGLYIFDTETGKLTGTIGGINWAQSLMTLHDGRVAVSYFGDNGQQLAIVDVEKGRLGESWTVQGDMYQAVVGGGDYDFYYNNGVNFFGYKLDTGKAEKLFNWINCDVDNSNLSGFTVTGDGKVIAISNEWNKNNDKAETSLITMEKVPADTLPQKETLTLACQYLDWYARSEIIKFNRSHDSIRIELRDYSEYNTDDDYEAGITKLRTEMLAGNCPDIIDLSGLPAKQLAAKGLLADLYPLLDADPELSREDFFPNVLKAMENNGKLYTTCSQFYIISTVGASSVVGTEPGWTYRELMDALAQMPDDCTVFSYSDTRTDVLQMCLVLDMDRFVNWNTGEVSFDSQEFIDLLNFAKNFPAEFDWENYEWTEEDDDYNRIREGRQLLITDYMSGFDNISHLENIFGGLDAFTYIGYPTSSGVGSMLNPNSGYAISEKCQNKEAAWEFVRVFLTEEYQDENAYNIPSNIHSYNTKKTNVMTPTYIKDENGNILLNPETGEKLMESKGGYWDNSKQEWVETYFYTQEEIDKIEEVILNTDRVYMMDSAISDIVNEQVQAFFSGQRSAEDVAKLIQSKAMIYVNEQR